MSVDPRVVSLGGEPVALFLGGVIGLLINGPLLIVLRNQLDRAPRVPPTVVALTGALFGAFSYCLGLVVVGRSGELVHGISVFLGDGRVPWALGFAFLAGGIVTYLTSRSSWHPAGGFVLLSLLLALGGWIGFLLTDRLPLAVLQGPLLQIGWIGFIITQILAATLLFVYAHYSIDAITRRKWRRVSTGIRRDPTLQPKVALHVPTFNEDPALVSATLDSLLAQDYPRDRMRIIVVDDSTDPGKVQGLVAACEARGIRLIHREQRSGFKAGALNEALRHTPEDHQVIGVIDADFQVAPDFLSDNVGFFIDPRIAFVQTPQEISNLDDSWVSRHAGIGQRFFYRTAMHSRNESEASMFCGSMGLVRKDAIKHVGGWLDGHVSEDADLSFRLKDAGYSSVYVGHKAYGHGLVPDGGESYRTQQGRWANGGARLLHDYFRRILTGPMTLKQKFHHLASCVFWFDGTLALVFAFTTSVLALAFLSGNLDLPIHEVAFVALLPVIVIADSTLRLAFVAKKRLDAAARDVFGLLLVWWSVKLVTATEAWSGLLGSSKPFKSTPKTGTDRLPRRHAALKSLRAAPIESAIAVWLALLSFAVTAKLVIVGADLAELALFSAVAFVLAFYTMYFAAAWIAVYMGHTSRRRRTRTHPAAAASPLVAEVAPVPSRSDTSDPQVVSSKSRPSSTSTRTQ